MDNEQFQYTVAHSITPPQKAHHLAGCMNSILTVDLASMHHLRATDQKYRESVDKMEISYFSFLPQNVYLVNYFQKSHL